jgi:NTP pyrophosphatase (non-canonical NTP hydrolase)
MDKRVIMEKEYPGTICIHCGTKHGKRECGVATWYQGQCHICGALTYVTEPRDFGHLKDSWEDEPFEEREVIDPRFPPTHTNIIEDYKPPEEVMMSGSRFKPTWFSNIQRLNDGLSAAKNFKVDAESAYRLVPEVGELVDVILKLEGKKRVKIEDSIHSLEEELRGEIGDVLVLLAQVATHYNIDMEAAYMEKYYKIMERKYHD